jgi:hypothetical protein
MRDAVHHEADLRDAIHVESKYCSIISGTCEVAKPIVAGPPPVSGTQPPTTNIAGDDEHLLDGDDEQPDSTAFLQSPTERTTELA